MNILQQLQLDVGGYLGSHTDFFYVPITVVRPRDAAAAVLIQETLNKSLAGYNKKNGKAGIVAMVLMPEAGVPLDRVKGYIRVEMVVRIIENPMVNEGATGTHVPAEDLALKVLSLLDGWDAGRKHEWRGLESRAMTPVNISGKVAYDVSVYCYHGADNPSQVAKPVMTVSGGNVTLSTGTPGAVIWYTLDGSFPGPANGEATEYTAPFATPMGTLRTAAYKDSFAPSDVLEKPMS